MVAKEGLGEVKEKSSKRSEKKGKAAMKTEFRGELWGFSGLEVVKIEE